MEQEAEAIEAAEAPVLSSGCSEAIRAELLDECEEYFEILQQLQNQIISADEGSGDGESNEAMNRLNAIMTELEQWQEMEPKLLSTNPEILLAIGKEEAAKTQLSAEDGSFLLSSKARCPERPFAKAWLEEKKEVLNAVTERVVTLREENENLSEHSILQDMKRKITKVKNFHSTLMETLSDMLAEHFPLPDQQAIGTKKKKGAVPDYGANLISLSEILEQLTNKTLETPHEPYVTIDDSFWPPYLEILLRNGIAIRHPEDCNKIRLESFQ